MLCPNRDQTGAYEWFQGMLSNHNTFDRLAMCCLYDQHECCGDVRFVTVPCVHAVLACTHDVLYRIRNYNAHDSM